MKKKDGWTRWVTDLRELNKQSFKDSYPLTNIQERLHSLQGTTVFSSLDACGAYHAVRIEPGSHAYTAFVLLACNITLYKGRGERKTTFERVVKNFNMRNSV